METFKRVLQYSRPYWWRIAIAMVATLGVAATDGAIAYLVAPMLKKVFTDKDMAIFYFLPFAVIIVFIFRGICRYVYDYFITTAGQLAIQDVRADIFRKSIFLSLRFFNNNSTGMLMSRVLNDVGAMQSGVANIVTGVIRDGVTVLGLLGVVFYRNWQLALISLVVIPLTLFPAQKIGKRIKNYAIKGQGKLGDITGVLQESFSGIKVIKAFAMEMPACNKFMAFNREYYHLVRKSVKYAAVSTPIMEVLTSFGIAAVIWFGGRQVIRGELTAPDFFSFVTAMGMLFSPIKKLLGTYNVIQGAIGAAERVFEIIDEKPDIVDPVEPQELVRASGNVTLKDVWYRYGEDGEWVLQNINLQARRGEIIALVGTSGGGKTTLVSLITRFYDVTRGAVLIDGIDIRSLRVKDLLNQVALVDQETILFNDTIANNIRYGNQDATDAEVEAAARAAFAHEFIMEMPDGYATNIGDRGVRLSGGQRQRVCIARAILKDAPILILDEATSALDTESEQMVQMALNNLMENRTTFVIAHRLSTILHADKIAVLDKGEVVESGTHTELLAREGVYNKLYQMQFKD
jgi:ATP-binding cassette, subfamily B, bacterial MsbA